MQTTPDAGPHCSVFKLAAVVIALAAACGPACAQMRTGASGGPPGGDKPPRGLFDEFKNQLREKHRQMLRRLRIDPEAKGDAKAAQEALREMAMLYRGGVRAPDEAAVDVREGGAPDGVVQPGLEVAERGREDGRVLAASAPVQGQQTWVEEEAARRMAALGLPRDTVATLPAAPAELHGPVPPEVVPGVPIGGIDEVAVMVPVPALRANGSVPLVFERDRRAGPDLPGGPLQDPVTWGVPIFGFAVEAAGNATSPRVPVFAVPVDWLDGWDRLEATLHVMSNQLLGTYMREGILYTASGQARLYIAPPKDLNLRKPPQERRQKKD